MDYSISHSPDFISNVNEHKRKFKEIRLKKKELKFNQRFAFMGFNLACRKMTVICGRTKIFKVSGHLNSGTKLLLFWPATFYSITTIRTLL